MFDRMKSLHIKLLLAFGLFISMVNVFGQGNLVPNPSFEEISDCPDDFSQVDLANGWSVYRPNADYFHSCSPTFLGVPDNWIGNQSAATGDAYCGFFTYHPTANSNELLGRKLTVPLTIGKQYYVSLKVSLAEKDGSGGLTSCGIDHIGILFSMKQYCYSLDTLTGACDSTPAPLTNSAHVYTSSIIMDTTNWTTIKGSVIADSAYEYVIVGNVFDAANTNFTLLNGMTSCVLPYYYVDDICVSEDSTVCFGTVGLDESGIHNDLLVFPNPTSKAFYIRHSNIRSPVSVSVYNTFGVLVNQLEFNRSIDQTKIDMSKHPVGYYLVEIKFKQFVATKKLAVIK